MMKLIAKTLPLLISAILMAPSVNAETIILDGNTLTVEQLHKASQPGNDVKITEAGWGRIKHSYDITIEGSKSGIPIYGLNTNFGELKGQKIAGKDVTKEPNRSASIAFNKKQMRIQAAGLEPFLENSITKMSMIIRLNQMAAGLTGMTTDGAEAFLSFVNNDVNPLIPSRGSMGINDLSWPTHIGLSLMGEWDVMYKGKRRDSKEVLDELGLEVYEPFGLDGISILSNGNVSMAILLDAMADAKKILEINPYLVAAGLETLNGNVSPYLWHSIEGKGSPMGHEAAEAVLESLRGSYLWEKNKKRALQDPLTFRGAHWTLAVALEEMQELEELLTLQINHTSDNPLTTIDGRSDMWYSNSSEVKQMLVNPGKSNDYINSQSSFDFTHIALQTEAMTKAIAHLLNGSAWRINQVNDYRRTKMTKYLVAESNVTGGVAGDGFANIVQPVSGVLARGLSLTNNVTLYGIPTSGSWEEQFTNVHLTADRLRQISHIAAELMSYEMFHMTQGAQMRRDEQGYQLGDGTERLLNAYREVVPFVTMDRIYTKDINNGVEFIKTVDLESLYKL
ncbi:aromatic amino acid lyase [Shewanella abyssi]|uniref:aromatic amino acid lyase n=1 Tax=Shewanella abyssi TaxID=311789 RepID=UPI00200F48BD|nr:aromatic amino acid lyase [Shewanella abyssi]MCL1049700.1 aromatic amino acid lyase [Shewanella abyssi]